MRVLVVVADTEVRDAVLTASLEQVRLARLPGYPETRVIETGTGTVVVLPCGTGALAVASVASIAASRISPAVVLAVAVLDDDSGIALPASVVVDGTSLTADEQLRTIAASRLSSPALGGVSLSPVVVGAGAAARTAGLALLALTCGGADAVASLAAVLPTLLAGSLRGDDV